MQVSVVCFPKKRKLRAPGRKKNDSLIDGVVVEVDVKPKRELNIPLRCLLTLVFFMSSLFPIDTLFDNSNYTFVSAIIQKKIIVSAIIQTVSFLVK